ncbi:MAG: transposase family protein [Chloroflexi bacterium]|uniref:DDE-type integrase/transposase/recombinase n=1 Tax=Candidatus Chlorohelix allophototropha TaxID=3003348 RepID=A0A8T7M3T1_9CHLR|nr:transposase family protein [Chloroflexota bacterium]WJW66108.1 DDE-type integrase/transposase/recombinase [Chloroflexota bacterium L227-S17]
MKSTMSYGSKRELLDRVAPRYREANLSQKSLILDEFIATTGYARKYAIRLLTQPQTDPTLTPLTRISRPRPPIYGPAVKDALTTAWAAANFICAKRLVPFLPELILALERHGHLTLTNSLRAQLLSISPATADRLLKAARQADQPHGISTTKAGKLLKHQVPIRTFAEWNEVKPGFLEIDLVAHCGNSAEGSYLYTLTLTDVATGWTECQALLQRSQHTVIQALDRVRLLLPFPILGIDSDNGSEFINNELIAYCEREKITFTRGRPYKKNDQCFVEQKNGAMVRQLIGYDRFEGEKSYRQLAEVYRATRLYVNFFQPSMKLPVKTRKGSSLYRKYDQAQTPFQRLGDAQILTAEAKNQLEEVARALDPVQLLAQLQTLQNAL